MISEFRALLVKNFKNLFRNWTSIFILVIGPLILMGILILAFSEMGFHNIRIGYTGKEAVVDPIRSQLSYLGHFQSYAELDSCLSRLRRQELHLCLDLEGEDITEVDVYFDNTREVISIILVSQLRRGVSRQKDVYLKSQALQLVQEVTNTRTYINEKQVSIDQIIVEIVDYQKDILAIRDRIIQAKQELDSHAEIVEEIKVGVGTTAFDYIDNYGDMSVSTKQEIDAAISDLEDARDELQKIGQSPGQILETIEALEDIKDSMQEIDSLVDDFHQQVLRVNSQVDNTLEQIRLASEFLELTQQRLGEIHQSLSQRVTQLETINKELGEKKQDLFKIEQMDIEQIVNPFLLNFKPLFEGSERIQELSSDSELTQEQAQQLLSIGSVQTLLPVIISLMICFISIIISNIIILDEKDSPAFVRNEIMPVSWVLHMSAILFTVLILLVIQVGIILGIGYSIFFLDIMGNLGIIILVSILMIIIYSLWGSALAYLIDSQTTSLLIATFFLIINIFISGMAFPVERMSPVMLRLSSMIPFRDGVSILQQAIFYQANYSILRPMILKLIMIAFASVIVLILSYWYFKKECEKGF